jgi:hypothetical protein
MLANNLNMSRDDAERWIVNLIRNAKLDAKIDAKEVSGCGLFPTGGALSDVNVAEYYIACRLVVPR